MTPNDIDKFTQVVSRALKVYGAPPSPDLIELWFDVLVQFDLGDVALALNRHVADPDSGRFQPKPADVIAHLSGSASTRSLRAWTLVEKAIRLVGPYRSVCFDDALTNAVLDGMGGWVKLAATETIEDLKFRGIEFQKRYQGVMQTGGVGEQYPPYLPGIHEAQNSFAYAAVAPPVLIGDSVRAKAVMERATGHTGLRVTHQTRDAQLCQVAPATDGRIGEQQ